MLMVITNSPQNQFEKIAATLSLLGLQQLLLQRCVMCRDVYPTTFLFLWEALDLVVHVCWM
jgi:hypothetical protein